MVVLSPEINAYAQPDDGEDHANGLCPSMPLHLLHYPQKDDTKREHNDERSAHYRSMDGPAPVTIARNTTDQLRIGVLPVANPAQLCSVDLLGAGDGGFGEIHRELAVQRVSAYTFRLTVRVNIVAGRTECKDEVLGSAGEI